MRTRRDSRFGAVAITVCGIILSGVLITLTVDEKGSEAPTGNPPPNSATGPETTRKALDADFMAGVIAYQEGRYHDSLLATERFIQRASTVPEAYLNQGFAFLALAQVNAAERAFDHALELNPQQANAYYGKGLIHESRGDLDLARGAMRTFIHLADEDDPFRRKATAALWEWGADPETAMSEP